MVGRQNTNFVPIDFTGFAAPDPKYDDWKPPADQVPVSGKGKDSRFTEEAVWAKSKRANLGAYASTRSQSECSDKMDKPKPKLDGTGSWGDFGVKAAAAIPQVDKSDGYVKGAPVPLSIDGMNQVLQQRVRAASAKTAAAYASPSVPARNVQKVSSAASPASSPSHKLIPPHLRKSLAGQTTSAASPSPKPTRTTQPQNATKAITVKDAPVVEDAEDVFALIQKRLDQQQEAAKTGRNMPVNKTFDQPASAFLPVHAIVGRPAPGNHFVVSTDWDQRKQSDTTLVDEIVGDEDEALAKKLQATELGLVDMKNAGDIIESEFNCFKSQQKATQDAKGAALYEKLHKVQEVLWKQASMSLDGFSKSKDVLFKMPEDDFLSYYNKVISAHLAQWDNRHVRLQQVAEIFTAHTYTVDELMAMSGSKFNSVFEELTIAHKHKAPASRRPSSDLDCRYVLTEDDLNTMDDAGELEFDSDGFGLSGSDDDDDEDVIFFKGHRRG